MLAYSTHIMKNKHLIQKGGIPRDRLARIVQDANKGNPLLAEPHRDPVKEPR